MNQCHIDSRLPGRLVLTPSGLRLVPRLPRVKSSRAAKLALPATPPRSSEPPGQADS